RSRWRRCGPRTGRPPRGPCGSARPARRRRLLGGPCASRSRGLGRDAVVLHELVQGLARDAAEPRPGDAEALELAVVEATDDRLLADFADLGGFAGREHGLHAYFHP